MHRFQRIKAWSNQDKFWVGNLNWHNVKTTTMTVSTMPFDDIDTTLTPIEVYYVIK